MRETFGGQESLSKTGRKKLPPNKVEQAFDILKGPRNDLMNKTVWNREKVRAKNRECFYNHYSPPCRTMTGALRGTRFRTKTSLWTRDAT